MTVAAACVSPSAQGNQPPMAYESSTYTVPYVMLKFVGCKIGCWIMSGTRPHQLLCHVLCLAYPDLAVVVIVLVAPLTYVCMHVTDWCYLPPYVCVSTSGARMPASALAFPLRPMAARGTPHPLLACYCCTPTGTSDSSST
jgi:hypothetical protein